MTSQYRHRRFSAPDKVFTALEPGEIAVNTANRQLSVGDAASGSIGTPLTLLAIRVFDIRAAYTTNDYVVHNGVIYRAKSDTGPGAFNPASWDVIAGQAPGVAPYVVRTGDTMTGHLALPPGPNADSAVRKDYVDGAIVTYVNNSLLPYATQSFVTSQTALSVLKTGSVMTGPLTLPGDPTSDLHASSKAYVDYKISTSVGIPTGAVMDFAMTTAPVGWLLCDGQAISRTTYAALFAAIGTTWGGGDGSTTFNIPNFKARYRRHRDAAGGLADLVGTYQNPANLAHTHNINLNSGYVSADHTHYVSGTTGAADRSLNHSHGGIPVGTNLLTSGTLYAPGTPGYMGGNTGRTATEGGVDHLHSFAAWSGGVSANHYHNVAGKTGGGSADNANELRPYSATVLTCIKT